MLMYPDINPVAFAFGPVKVHWYGLMYLVGFIAAWIIFFYRNRKFQYGWTNEQIIDLLFYLSLGVVVGGRLGYVLFYNPLFYLSHPIQIPMLWDGGMSFHGGMIGVFLALWYWAYRVNAPYFKVTDFIAPAVPIGLAAGRLGNFINGELWGRVTRVPWGMVFPDGGPLPRHPSQLYEALLEGVVLFFILWFYSGSRPPRMAVSGMFLLGYGLFRFIGEFFRQPDIQLGFVSFGWMTRGQELSLPMIALGIILLFIAYSKNIREQHATIS